MEEKWCKVLVDTGSEVCLIREGLAPPEHTQEATTPINLVAANRQRLSGGSKVAEMDLEFAATHSERHKENILTTPTILYEAAMGDDIILSYDLLVERGIAIYPRKHGLRTRVNNATYWIPSDRAQPATSSTRNFPREPVYARVATSSVVDKDEPKPRAFVFVLWHEKCW